MLYRFRKVFLDDGAVIRTPHSFLLLRNIEVASPAKFLVIGVFASL